MKFLNTALSTSLNIRLENVAEYVSLAIKASGKHCFYTGSDDRLRRKGKRRMEHM